MELWIESRNQSIKYYRSNTVFAQLCELGYDVVEELNYGSEITTGQLKRCKNDMWDALIEPDDVEEYEKCKDDRLRLQATYLTFEQFKKIQLLKYLGIDPCVDYDKEHLQILKSYSHEIKQYKWLQSLVKGDLNAFEAIQMQM